MGITSDENDDSVLETDLSLEDTEDNRSNDSIRMSAVKVLATRSSPPKDPSEQIANPGEPAAKKLKCQLLFSSSCVGCCCYFKVLSFFPAAHKESMFVTLSAIADEDMACLKDYLRQQYTSEVSAENEEDTDSFLLWTKG